MPEVARGQISLKATILLGVLLGTFVLLQCGLPLRTAIKIGADEDFELAKATLSLKGYHFYTEVWNDQPLLHTFLITQFLKRLSPSVLGPRLVTSAFAILLLTSLFFISLRISGLLVAALATGLLIVSPGFLELSSSCMVEVPGLAPAVAGMCVVLIGSRWRGHVADIVAGILFAVALQVKFIGLIYLPIAGLVLWLRHRETKPNAPTPAPSKGGESRKVGTATNSVPLPGGARGGFMDAGEGTATTPSRFFPRSIVRSLLFFAASLGASFIVIQLLVGESSLWVELKQSWFSHFAATKSFEYGSPNDHPFEWAIFLKNWDTTTPALLGIVVCLLQIHKTHAAIIPLTWFALDLVVFGIHKPWWAYYYVHNAVPLCWCAAIGLEALWKKANSRRSSTLFALATMYVLCAGGWMASRVYLQVTGIQNSPQTYHSLVLSEIERFKPFTQFIYTDELIYSFHTGIPVPPKLGTISLKRLWSADMTNEKIAAELWATKPGLILLANNTRAVPFHDLLTSEYRLAYEDDKHRLYARKDVIAQIKY